MYGVNTTPGSNITTVTDMLQKELNITANITKCMHLGKTKRINFHCYLYHSQIISKHLAKRLCQPSTEYVHDNIYINAD